MGTVLGGPAVLAHGFAYALLPVALNCLLLLLVAYLFNNATRHPYPHKHPAHGPGHAPVRDAVAPAAAAVDEQDQGGRIRRAFRQDQVPQEQAARLRDADFAHCVRAHDGHLRGACSAGLGWLSVRQRRIRGTRRRDAPGVR